MSCGTLPKLTRNCFMDAFVSQKRRKRRVPSADSEEFTLITEVFFNRVAQPPTRPPARDWMMSLSIFL